MSEKIISLEEAMDKVHDGQTIMMGGFAGTYAPQLLIRAIADKGVKDITLIGNDTGDDNVPGDHQAILTRNKLVKKAIVSHIGMNKETVRQFNEGEIEVEFSPQGTLVERIRSGGYGLGGVLTPTGVGTDIAEGKEVLEINGKEYLLEMPLRADVAIIKANKADKIGNIVVHGTAVSHSLMMLTAADLTIVQVDEIVEDGEIHPDHVSVPGIFVDYLVEGSNKSQW